MAGHRQPGAGQAQQGCRGQHDQRALETQPLKFKRVQVKVRQCLRRFRQQQQRQLHQQPGQQTSQQTEPEAAVEERTAHPGIGGADQLADQNLVAAAFDGHAHGIAHHQQHRQRQQAAEHVAAALRQRQDCRQALYPFHVQLGLINARQGRQLIAHQRQLQRVGIPRQHHDHRRQRIAVKTLQQIGKGTVLAKVFQPLLTADQLHRTEILAQHQLATETVDRGIAEFGLHVERDARLGIPTIGQCLQVTQRRQQKTRQCQRNGQYRQRHQRSHRRLLKPQQSLTRHIEMMAAPAAAAIGKLYPVLLCPTARRGRIALGRAAVGRAAIGRARLMRQGLTRGGRARGAGVVLRVLRLSHRLPASRFSVSACGAACG